MSPAYTAYMLTPSFQLRKVVVVDTSPNGTYALLQDGAQVRIDRLHASVKQAVKSGITVVKLSRDAVRKRRKENDLRAANLARIENAAREDGTWQ